MALIKCPECGKEFSDKAFACPNCGCPISEIRKMAEEEKQKNIVELKLEGSYSLKYDEENIGIYSSGIFVFSAPKEEFVLNYGKEENDYGRDQLKIVFSHKGYGDPFIICVNKTSERYADSKKFLESIAEKYFTKDIQDDYFRAGTYAKNHVDKNIELENKRNFEKEKSLQKEPEPRNENETPAQQKTQVTYDAPEKKKKKGCCGVPVWVIGWIFIIAVLIHSCSGNNDSRDGDDTYESSDISATVSPTPLPRPTVTERPKRNTATPKPQLSPRDQFIQDSSEYLSSDISGKLYDILINDIGFSDADFYGKVDIGDSVWEVHCDDMAINVVASDDIYRIWGGDFTFYENGTVVTTKQQMEDVTISDSDRTSYYLIAKEIVMSSLKNPSSASFPWTTDDIAFVKREDIVAVQGYVDAMNSFGSQIRSQWTVEFRIIDLSAFTYETLYINIDGQTVGTYTDIG